MSRENPSLEELQLLRALTAMAQQYLAAWSPSGMSQTYLNHQFMSAGEACIAILDSYGLVEKDACGGSLTTRAIVVAENEGIDASNYEKVKAEYLTDEGQLLSSLPGWN